MKRYYKIMDITTILFIIVTMIVNMWMTFIAQGAETNLTGGTLFCFMFGFVGTIFCSVIRFVFSFYFAFRISNKIKKTSMILYMTVWSIIYIRALWITLQLGNFSVTYLALGEYNAFQIFACRILIAQCLGDRLFLDKSITKREIA